MKIKKKDRWMHNYILVHVARTWERIRLTTEHQEMPQDNIESANESIPYIAERIYFNDIIQGYLNASEEVKDNDYWDKNTGTMSDCYIEAEAVKIIRENYLED